MEMKLPEAWSPLANTIPALWEVHWNVQHKETCNNRRELTEHILSNTPPAFGKIYFIYLKILTFPTNAV